MQAGVARVTSFYYICMLTVYILVQKVGKLLKALLYIHLQPNRIVAKNSLVRNKHLNHYPADRKL